MFDVTWGPALAVFSTTMESANGTIGALYAIATEEELEDASENVAESIKVCLASFHLVVCTVGLCGNEMALLCLARNDGELLGTTWEHIFRALSKVVWMQQVYHSMARNNQAAVAATECQQ
eukprot:5819488-Ditylum_brightwellii.AAC.1